MARKGNTWFRIQGFSDKRSHWFKVQGTWFKIQVFAIKKTLGLKSKVFTIKRNVWFKVQSFEKCLMTRYFWCFWEWIVYDIFEKGVDLVFFEKKMTNYFNWNVGFQINKKSSANNNTNVAISKLSAKTIRNDILIKTVPFPSEFNVTHIGGKR